MSEQPVTEDCPLPYWHSDTPHTNPLTGDELVERTYSEGYPDPRPRFLGTGTIAVQRGGASGGLPFEFSIAAKSVREAFMRYKAHLMPAGEEQVKRLQAAEREAQLQASRQILVPSPVAKKPS